MVGQVVLVDETLKVQVGVVGGEEEDPGEEKLVVAIVML